MANDRALGGAILGGSVLGIIVYGVLLYFYWRIILEITAFLGSRRPAGDSGLDRVDDGDHSSSGTHARDGWDCGAAARCAERARDRRHGQEAHELNG